ncbi:allose kinase [soil metagenome]
MGGTSVRLGHTEDGQPKGMHQTLPTAALRHADDPLEWLSTVVRRYSADHSLNLTNVVIGVPFTPDAGLTTAVSSPNIPNLENVPITEGLGARLGVRVRLERDINLLLLGEWTAGAAFLQDGVPFRGATGAALELGHIPIRAEGRRCVCGNLDCLEAYACGHVLDELAEESGLEVATIFQRGREHPETSGKLDAFVRDLAFGLATAVNLFHPNLALVGGGVPMMPSFPKEAFEQTFYAHLRRPVPATTVDFAWAVLGSEAALWGSSGSAKRGTGVSQG